MRWVTQRVKSPGVPQPILRAPSPRSQYFMRFRAFIWPGVGMVGVSYCWLSTISLVGVVVWGLCAFYFCSPTCYIVRSCSMIVFRTKEVTMNDVAQIITAITGSILAIHKIAIEWKQELDNKPVEENK